MSLLKKIVVEAKKSEFSSIIIKENNTIGFRNIGSIA